MKQITRFAKASRSVPKSATTSCAFFAVDAEYFRRSAALGKPPAEVRHSCPAAVWYNCDMNVTTILDRFLDPVTQILPPDTARQILDLRLDPQLQSRLDVLAEKANQGSLSAEEREEYEEYVEGLDLIAVFKLKARAALRRQAS